MWVCPLDDISLCEPVSYTVNCTSHPPRTEYYASVELMACDLIYDFAGEQQQFCVT